jgi:hypothetical protein
MSNLYGLKSCLVNPIACLLVGVLDKFHLLPSLLCDSTEKNESYKVKLKQSRLLFVKGWSFRVPELATRYHDHFVKKYTILHSLYSDNSLVKLIEHEKSLGTILIGVHVRKGDYKSWKGGLHFYQDSVYENCIKELRNQLSIEDKNIRIQFIIFSNEKITMAAEPDIIYSMNPWYLDQLLMSRCDYLIGPPSTFTIWASYIGKVKYYHIENASDPIHLEKFHYHHY